MPAPSPTEHSIQAAFFAWIRLSRHRYPALRLCFAVPNAGQRSIGAAQWMLAEGLEAGIPDVLLVVPRHDFTGLAIEFKRPGGKLSERQVEKIRLMRDEGWLVHVMDDAEMAIREVRRYLE